MWISRTKWRELEAILVELQRNQEVTYGVPMYTIGGNEFRPGTDMKDVVGKTIPAKELLCAIANHLGFTYKTPNPGGITPPDPVADPPKRK